AGAGGGVRGRCLPGRPRQGRRRTMRTGSLLLVLVGAAACGGDISGADRGAELFESSDLSPSDLNVFSCATCHSTEQGAGPTDGHPGYRLFGAAARTRYWGEDYSVLEDAVSACLVFFMKADPVDPADDDLHAVYEYLLSITPDGAGDEPYAFTGIDPSLVVIEKVRHGRFFNIGGEMPLFSEEALSDDDLGALLAYLEL